MEKENKRQQRIKGKMEKKNNLLSVRNLNVYFDDEQIIKDFSFNVKKGDIITIIGPNGSGKTTLLNALLGMLPSNGRMTGIIKWQPKVKINYLPQDFSKAKFSKLPLTIRDFFRFKTKSDDEIIKMLSKVGLKRSKNILDRNPSKLSSGQFQRLLIAWSLIDDPDVLLLDEPTAGLDIGGEETVYSLLKKFWDKHRITILLITHDLNIVYGYSSYCLCMSKNTHCYGVPQDVLTPQKLRSLYGNKIKFYKHKHII